LPSLWAGGVASYFGVRGKLPSPPHPPSCLRILGNLEGESCLPKATFPFGVRGRQLGG